MRGWLQDWPYWKIYMLHRAPGGHQTGGGVSGMPSTHSSAGGGVTSGLTTISVSRMPSTHSSSGGGVTEMQGSSSIGSKTKTGGRSYVGRWSG